MTWRFWEAVLIWIVGNILVGAIIVVGLVVAISGSEPGEELSGSLEIVATILADTAFVATIVIWLSRRHRGWVAALGLPPRTGPRTGPRTSWLREAGWGALAGVLLYPAIAIVVGIPLQLFFQLFSQEPVSTPEQLPSNLSTTGEVLAVVLAVLVAPVTEELFYRGVLFRSVRDRHGFWPGALVSALLFGLVHFVPAPWQDFVLLQSIMVFTGLALAWVYERRGTIVASIAAHMVFNIIGITFILGFG
ncbi:MAG TPA: CPBP family intramembrane glutamic endopeptidase [Actinomycetota bacterium]